MSMWSHSTDSDGSGMARSRPLIRAVTLWFCIASCAAAPVVLAAWSSTFPVLTDGPPLDQHNVPNRYLRLPHLVHLSIKPRDLADLLENPTAKGRRWERVGHI